MQNPSRRWCFTQNTPEEDIEDLTLQPGSHVRYLIYQLECAANLHFQGYIEFSQPVRLAHCVSLFPDNKPHFEVARGSREQCIAYCSKQDDTYLDGPWEFGSKDVKPGKRTDLDAASADFKSVLAVSGASAAMASLANDHTGCFVKFHRGFQALSTQLTSQQAPRDVRSFFIYGPTGTGKTAFVYDSFGWSSSDVYALSSQSPIWFDGYAGQRVLLIDEYSGHVPRETLLRILDRYPYGAPVKGSTVNACWDLVFITSNLHLSLNWCPAVLRRFNATLAAGLYGSFSAADGPPRIHEFTGVRGDFTWDAATRSIVAAPPGPAIIAPVVPPV